jgi:hypothetical protein
MPIALDSPHPEHVVRTIVDCLLAPHMPVMNRGTWSVLARMTASECEGNEKTATFEREITSQRQKAGSLRRMAQWKLLAGTKGGARKKTGQREQDPDQSERLDALMNVLDARGIDELIDACGDRNIPESELLCILGHVIERLVRKRDARFTAEQRARLGQILGAHIASPSGDSRPDAWSHQIVRNTWRIVAHGDAARQFLEQYRPALERFFRTYIQHLPEGTPFDRWRQILGDPHAIKQNHLTYRAQDGDRVYELYLGLDREGRLWSWQEGPR